MCQSTKETTTTISTPLCTYNNTKHPIELTDSSRLKIRRIPSAEQKLAKSPPVGQFLRGVKNCRNSKTRLKHPESFEIPKGSNTQLPMHLEGGSQLNSAVRPSDDNRCSANEFMRIVSQQTPWGQRGYAASQPAHPQSWHAVCIHSFS